MSYHCQGLNAITRARSVDDAARMFAHRLATKMFGRAGRMLAIERVRHGQRWHQYCIRLGKTRGPMTDAMLLVTIGSYEIS
jgi:hypothetical protein